jgi:phage tail-like protein
MSADTGYLHLHRGTAWPSLTTGPTIEIDAATNEIRLAATGGGGGGGGGGSASASFATSGAFLIGPLQVLDRPTSWFRVRAAIAGASDYAADASPALQPSQSHIQFFTFTAKAGAPVVNLADATPFTGAGWTAVARDGLDFAVRSTPDVLLFIGGIMRGDGSASPGIEQMRVWYGRDTYAKFLPGIYQQQGASTEFLERLLGLEQVVLGGIENEIADLPRRMDTAASPSGDPPSWLGWLSGWMAFLLDEHWTDADARRYLAGAFDLYGQRGTIEGLRQYLRMYAGVEAHISEPSREASIWSLGDAGLLGFSTMLAPGPLQGAVLDTSATVDQSHLTNGDSFGAALFEDVAHRFCVQVYCAELTRPGAIDAVRAVLDREKPAHTTYDLCVIEPMFRVGVQARVGIDAIVAAAPQF